MSRSPPSGPEVGCPRDRDSPMMPPVETARKEPPSPRLRLPIGARRRSYGEIATAGSGGWLALGTTAVGTGYVKDFRYGWLVALSVE